MTYQEIGKTPEEIAEILDKSNILIAQYDDENKALKERCENLTKAVKAMTAAMCYMLE